MFGAQPLFATQEIAPIVIAAIGNSKASSTSSSSPLLSPS